MTLFCSHRPRTTPIRARLFAAGGAIGLAQFVSAGVHMQPQTGAFAPEHTSERASVPLVDALLWDLSGDDPLAIEASLALIADDPSPPSDALLPRGISLAQTQGDHRPAALRALARWPRPQTVHLLIDVLSGSPGLEVASAARVGLTQATGLRQSDEAWASWADRRRALPEHLWNEALIRDLLAAREATHAQRTQAAQAAAAFARRLYLLTPPGDRPAQLVSLLRSPVPDVRLSAIAIAEREVAAGRPFTEPVYRALSGLLDSDSPGDRAGVAVVLGRTGTAESLDRIIDALHREPDPEAAASMLSAVARTPTEETLGDALRWLAVPGPTLEPAAEAVAETLLRPDWPKRDAVMLAARAALGQNDPAACGPQRLRLLSLLAETAGELDTLVALLEDPERRDDAARALALSQLGLARLEPLAKRDASLATAAGGAIARRADGADVLRRLIDLAWPERADVLPFVEIWAQRSPLNDVLDQAERAEPLVRAAALQAATNGEPQPKDEALLALALVRLHIAADVAERADLAAGAMERLVSIDPAVWSTLSGAERQEIESALPTSSALDRHETDHPAGDQRTGSPASGEPVPSERAGPAEG